jgi:hypothetical protein
VTAATRDRLVFAFALCAGAVTWLAVGAFAERKEAWDSSLYGTAALPVSYALLAGLGYVASRAAWRWPLLVFGGQLAAMLARNGVGGSLLPLGGLVFALLALFGLLPTYLGVALRRRRQRLLAARFAAARQPPLGPGAA